jgi:hypothetical protein
MYREELTSKDLLHEIQFQDMQFDHLEWDRVYSHVLLCYTGSHKEKHVGNDVRSNFL